MDRRATYKPVQCRAVWDILIEGISSWVIGKVLDHLWRNLRRKRVLKTGETVLHRFGDIMLHFATLPLETQSIDVKFSIEINAKKHVSLKRALEIYVEIMRYAVLNP